MTPLPSHAHGVIHEFRPYTDLLRTGNTARSSSPSKQAHNGQLVPRICHVCFLGLLLQRGILTNPSRTKAGVYNSGRKRDKMLRTYGRKGTTTPEARSSPTKKRVRFATEVQEQEIYKNEPPSACRRRPTRPDEDEEAPEATPTKSDAGTPSTPAKHTILNYFKPVSPSPTAAKAVKRPREEIDESESPLPVSKPTKRRRLLSVRPSRFLTDAPSSDADDEGANDARRRAAAKTKTPKEESTPLQEGGEALHNRRPLVDSAPGDKKARKEATSQVQTTLNISSKGTITECKVCDTVWNPLYPDDVKYHTKRHAAHLRAATKKQAEEL